MHIDNFKLLLKGNRLLSLDVIQLAIASSVRVALSKARLSNSVRVEPKKGIFPALGWEAEEQPAHSPQSFPRIHSTVSSIGVR